MGKIHENCLNEWVVRSRKDCCEICKAEYAKSGNVLLPLRQWTRPEIDIVVCYNELLMWVDVHHVHFCLWIMSFEQLILKTFLNRMQSLLNWLLNNFLFLFWLYFVIAIFMSVFRMCWKWLLCWVSATQPYTWSSCLSNVNFSREPTITICRPPTWTCVAYVSVRFLNIFSRRPWTGIFGSPNLALKVVLIFVLFQ